MELFGRTEIFSGVDEVNITNVVEVLGKAKPIFEKNEREITYLYDYYRGNQPILRRKKPIRPEICNKVVENRANEIVAFKVGYLCGEPIQYVSRSAMEDVSKNVSLLNDMMLADSKATKDKALVEWQMIAGTAYRIVMVSSDPFVPFELCTIDPRNAFVIRSSKIGNKVLAGVHCGKDSEGKTIFTVYTPNEFYEVDGNKVRKAVQHGLGAVPVIEYPANNARMGAFEPVVGLLDAINTVESNRIDGIEQFVQSLVKFINCDIDEEKFAALQQMGAIKIKSSDGQNADVEIMTQELNQTQTQTLVDHLYQTVLTICGMPNRNGNGSSTSDTGAASLLRDGWTLAEARAKDSELMFKQSETDMLKVVLPLCESLAGLNLKITDFTPKFTRRNYENIQTKAQVLVSMLNNEKVDPRLAFAHCGMFPDPEEAYQVSMRWYQERQKQMQKSLKDAVRNDGAESVSSV